jgi:hypothetical protein
LSSSPFQFAESADPPLEIVEVTPTGDHQLPAHITGRIVVYTPHDGGAIPDRYHYDDHGKPRIDPETLQRHHVSARDWGANAVANHVAAALGLRRYARCRIARVLLDFNRFPGSTPPRQHHPLESLAIGELYANALNHDTKTELLDTYYDAISSSMEALFSGSLIGISIHTYDETHASKTKRADLSLISLPLSYQREARLTYGVFDPAYPDHLAESTCSRILRDRVSLNLERSGFRVTHNHPYPVPDGSIEMRAQVWHFFRYVRERFEAEHPDTRNVPAYTAVWTMLLDTNLRLAEADALRGFIHRFRRVEQDRRAELGAALSAYRQVKRFIDASTVVTDYRRSPERPSSLAIEIRKDLVCTFDPKTGYPERPNEAQKKTAREIAGAIATAISIYIDTDRPAYEQAARERPPPPTSAEPE